MGEMVGSKRDVGSDMPYESPLVPNRKMKRMYEGIVELRMLEDMLRKRHKKAKRPSGRGQEACRVSALIDLTPDDLTSDTSIGLETAFLRGVPLQALVAHADSLAPGKKSDKKKATATKLHLSGLLPSRDDTTDRFNLALGAASAIKRLKLPHVVVIFATRREIKLGEWQRNLQFAAKEELPVLFVALPEPGEHPSGKSASSTKLFELSARATTAGLPGIPVDASDAVALYRVAQESIGRARAGGGPALMECLHIEGGKKKDESDPVVMMGQSLLKRKICEKQWLADVSNAFKALLNAL
jgi:TPP-dependent pyruvate/acetoin dehydrogenase alpha subunit